MIDAERRAYDACALIAAAVEAEMHRHPMAAQAAHIIVERIIAARPKPEKPAQ